MSNVFICNRCEKSFSKKYNLCRHILICNDASENRTKHRIICPLCYDNFHKSSTLDEHLIKNHQVNITCEEKYFDSEEEFFKWKEEMERITKCWYRRGSTSKKSVTMVVYFQCHRSGFFRSRSTTRKRRSCGRGSCKIDGSCPARIIMQKVKELVRIRYYPTHVGHSNEIQFLRLPKSIEEAIAEQLKQGVSLDKILEKRDELVPESDSPKKILINRKKLHNILQKYRIPYPGRNQTDDTLDTSTPVRKRTSRKPVKTSPSPNQTENNTDACVEEMVVVMADSQLRIEEDDKSFINSTYSPDRYEFEFEIPSQEIDSFVREEICITSSNENHDSLVTNGNIIAEKLHQALDILERKPNLKIEDDKFKKLDSCADELLRILTAQ